MALHKSLFQEFDTDSNGSISFSELRTALEALGMNVSEPIAKYLFEQIDTDSSGQIELDEFEHFIFVFQNADFNSPASVIFYAADHSHDEEIGTSELQHALLKLNVRRTREECRRLSARVTGRTGRRLDYGEFLEVLQILREEGEVLQTETGATVLDGDPTEETLSLVDAKNSVKAPRSAEEIADPTDFLSYLKGI